MMKPECQQQRLQLRLRRRLSAGSAAATGMTATRLTRVEEEDGDRENPFRPGGQLAQEAAGFVAQAGPASPASGAAAASSNGKESSAASLSSPQLLEDTVRLVTAPTPGGDGSDSPAAATEGEVVMALSQPERAEKVELGGGGDGKGRGCCELM